MELIDDIRTKFRENQFEFSPHAVDRMILRHVAVTEVQSAMTTKPFHEELVEKKVTYTLLKDEKFFIIEGVPARVNVETGEELFSPETVEKLQQIIWEQKKPVREITTPVYEYTS